MQTTTTTKTEWRKTFAAALVRAMARAGVTESVRFETCTTDQTWGDRVGLVFFGASAAAHPPVERREGVATSYVYYPGAE